jgi:hypothetical protein
MWKHIYIYQKRLKTDRLTPDSCQTQTPLDLTTGATKTSFAFLSIRVVIVRT